MNMAPGSFEAPLHEPTAPLHQGKGPIYFYPDNIDAGILSGYNSRIMTNHPSVIAFEGDVCIASGELAHVTLAAKKAASRQHHEPILIFDGKCVLCSATVKFVLAHDRRRRVRFVVAQSPLGAALYRHFGLKSEHYDTNIVLENGVALTKSESSIRIFELVGSPWSLLTVLRLLPRFVREPLYEVVARNRLIWFGERETCYLPNEADRARFLG